METVEEIALRSTSWGSMGAVNSSAQPVRLLTMKHHVTCCVVLCLATLATLAPGIETEAGWVPLFDGETFAGWEGDLTKFRIEDGAIIGGNLRAPLDRNYFLCTTERYDHFELRLKVKLVGENANAGIKLRAERIPDNTEVIGYQADIGQQYWGCLYDESRRRTILQQPDPKLIKKTVKPGEWNDNRIRCEGKRIQLWPNGEKTVDYIEEETDIPLEGIIGLQIHSGPPAEVSYRDIRIIKVEAPGNE